MEKEIVADRKTEVQFLLKVFMERDPQQIIKDYHEFISLIKDFITCLDNELYNSDIMKKVGLTHTQFYYRLNNPSAWTKQELEILIETMNWVKK